MKGKVKVLFVVSEFYQAGAQRFTYEMDKAIDKDMVDLNILCLLPLGHNPAWEDHYFNKHIELGTKIFFLNDIAKPFIPTFKQRIDRKIFNKPFPQEHDGLNNFLDSYDVILFNGEYNYPILARKLTPAVKAKVLISINISKHQKHDNYVHYDKSEPYYFVSGFKDDEIKYELSEFSHYNHFYLPLSIQIEESGRQWSYRPTDAPKIGIFTRLTYTKPLDPFIYAFHTLLNDMPHAELHIFGTGDPQKEGVMKYLKHLGMLDKVKFRGHQENLKETAIKEKLNLVWFHGYYGEPGGFAGFDICSLGLPQLFWNFGDPTDNNVEVFPMYNNINAFAQRTIKVLQNEEEANKLSLSQYEYIREVRNIRKSISGLEALFLTFKSAK
jgi:glycosyltransferase involved in cell wall biosynthesis